MLIRDCCLLPFKTTIVKVPLWKNCLITKNRIIKGDKEIEWLDSVITPPFRAGVEVQPQPGL